VIGSVDEAASWRSTRCTAGDHSPAAAYAVPVTAGSATNPLPLPTGPYPVGRVSYDWVDTARAEIYAANPDERRELVVFLWYPAQPDPTTEFAPYLPAGLGTHCGVSWA
jgi:hypothetical protein